MRDQFHSAELTFVCLGCNLTTLRDQFQWAELNFVRLDWQLWETSFAGQNWTLSALVGYTLRDQFHWAELNFALVGYTERPVSLGRTELCLGWLHWETSFTGQNWTLPWLATLQDWFHWAGLNFVCLGWLYTERPVSLGRTELCLASLRDQFHCTNWTLSALIGNTWETSFTGQDWTLPGFTERPVSLYKLNSVCLDWLHMRDQFHWAGLNFVCLGWLHCQTSFTGQNRTECHL